MAKFRPHMPLSVKLDACLILLGLAPRAVQWDHDPALELRQWDDAAGDYVPAANDPHHIVPREPAEHKLKTTGRRGESDLSISFNGDASRIAKTNRLAPEHEAFRRTLLTKEPGQPRERKGTIPRAPKTPKPRRATATGPLTKTTLCFHRNES